MINHEIRKGVNLHLIRDQKFKTAVFSLYIYIPMTRSNTTKTSLLSNVLKQGTHNYKTSAHISKYLADLYGAEFICDIRKKGDAIVLYITCEFVSGKIIGENLDHKIIDFMHEVIFNTLTTDGSFNAEYVDREKENLKKFIEALVNDKAEYAHTKCLQAMFNGEAYGLYEYGDVSDLPDIDSRNLYEYYKTLIETARMDILFSGNFDEKKAVPYIIDKFRSSLGNRDANYQKISIKGHGDLKDIKERMDVKQSKLCIGLSCNVDPFSEQYYALVLCNSILGGNPISKLFNNVREKLGLAYHVSSRLDRFKSIIVIDCGIEAVKYQTTYDEIVVQLGKIKDGEIEGWEMDSAKRYLANSFNSVCDNLFVNEDYNLSQLIMQNDQSIPEFLKHIASVTKNDIVEAARKIEVDTIYYLTSEE